MPGQKQPILLTIVIVSYNTPKLVIECLNSIIFEVEGADLLGHKTEIIVIDNHSSDDSVKQIDQFLASLTSSAVKVILVKNNQNSGFAKANNQALKNASGEYFLLLNSDTLMRPGSLVNLVSNLIWAKTHSRIGLLAGDLKNPDGSKQHQGGALPNLWTLKTHMLMLSKIPLLNKFLSSTQNEAKIKLRKLSSPRGQLQIQGWVGGAALIIPKEIYLHCGPLDENIFMYGEDTEYCLRARKAGFLCAIDLSAPITHLAFASSSSSQALIGEMTGLLYIFKKHHPAWQLPIAYMLLLMGCYLRICLFSLSASGQTKVETYKQAVSQLKKRYNTATAKS